MPGLHYGQLPTVHAIPRSHGLCRFCLRDMWTGDAPRGKAVVGPDRTMCTACHQIITTGGGDPCLVSGTKAEQVPAERPEDNPRWRDDPDRNCRDLPPLFFDDDLDADDPEYVEQTKQERSAVWMERRKVARRLCHTCPVMEQCRAAALAHGYEGLWGGAWFSRNRWEDLVTRESGATIHARGRARKRDAERRVGDVAA